MASKTTLNAKNLEALGTERLAQLLIEVSTGSAASKRKLRLALAGSQSPREAAREIGKRLASIATARSMVTWKTRKTLVADLETQRRAILEEVAPSEPAEAWDLLWRFMALVEPVYERCDDSSGTVIAVFHAACADLGRLAETLRPDPAALAERIVGALLGNRYGEFDGLIAIMTPALGEDGLATLRSMLEEIDRAPRPVPPKAQWKAMGWGPSGTFYEHEVQERAQRSAIREALLAIADALGDVDGFIARCDPDARKVPYVAAEIAQRLLAAGRADEALAFIDGTETADISRAPHAWHHARLAALEALGRGAEAQAVRWDNFERTLSEEDLRDYLRRLPDFEDFEAEERAMAHAKAFPGFFTALAFFLRWPAPSRAADLILARAGELDGNRYDHLSAAAEALSERHPLAATLALRAMIGFTLAGGRSQRYRYAAADLETCARLAPAITDFGALETHDTFFARLKRDHGRKYGFWSHMAD